MTAPLGNLSKHCIWCRRRKYCDLDTGRSHRKRRQGVAGWRGSGVGLGFRLDLLHFTGFFFFQNFFSEFFLIIFFFFFKTLAWLD